MSEGPGVGVTLGGRAVDLAPGLSRQGRPPLPCKHPVSGVPPEPPPIQRQDGRRLPQCFKGRVPRCIAREGAPKGRQCPSALDCSPHGDAGQVEPRLDGAQVSKRGQLHLQDVTSHFFPGKGRKERGTGRGRGGSGKGMDWEEGW